MTKRERWTEADLAELPIEEPDNFDRKSGKLFDDQSRSLDAVAKALSAFANSGGGSLILGVMDDGIPDGLPKQNGRASIRDWIEQKIPNLLEYPLSDFRVHTVIRDSDSRIPRDREVIVIDVGDSAAAPHQSKRDHIYYHRVAGRSLPANHFYLELLRQRLTNPVLELTLREVKPSEITEFDGGLYVEMKFTFEIKNVSRVAAYNWRLIARTMEISIPERSSDYYFTNFPVKIARSTGIPIDITILPGCEYWEHRNFGIVLRPYPRTPEMVRQEIRDLLLEAKFNYQLATETSPGELVSISPWLTLDVEALVAFALQGALHSS
jgi:hypothetical protein